MSSSIQSNKSAAWLDLTNEIKAVTLQRLCELPTEYLMRLGGKGQLYGDLNSILLGGVTDSNLRIEFCTECRVDGLGRELGLDWICSLSMLVSTRDWPKLRISQEPFSTARAWYRSLAVLVLAKNLAAFDPLSEWVPNHLTADPKEYLFEEDDCRDGAECSGCSGPINRGEFRLVAVHFADNSFHGLRWNSKASQHWTLARYCCTNCQAMNTGLELEALAIHLPRAAPKDMVVVQCASCGKLVDSSMRQTRIFLNEIEYDRADPSPLSSQTLAVVCSECLIPAVDDGNDD